MKTGMLMLAALALTPIAVYAHDDSHQATMPGMHGMAEVGHVEDGGTVHGVGKPGDPK